MIELTCWGCGWEGRVRKKYAGLRVTCKRCRSSNLVPDPVTDEIEVAGWFAEFDRRGGPPTQFIEVPVALRETA